MGRGELDSVPQNWHEQGLHAQPLLMSFIPPLVNNARCPSFGAGYVALDSRFFFDFGAGFDVKTSVGAWTIIGIFGCITHQHL